jgi:hypothetical protein
MPTLTGNVTITGDLTVAGAGGAELPAGGSEGQLLAKASAADGDVEWADPSGGAEPADVTLTGTYAALPAAGTAGRLYLPSDSPYVLRDTGAAWAAWGPLHPLTVPPASGWSWVNQGGASLDTTGGPQTIAAPSGSGNSARLRTRAAPSTPYTITALVGVDALMVNFTTVGIGFRQSSDGKLSLLYVQSNIFNIGNYTSPTSFSANAITSLSAGGHALSRLWMRITDNGTNRIYQVSATGRVWLTLYTVARTTFLTADEVCFGVDVNHASHTAGVTLLSWAIS